MIPNSYQFLENRKSIFKFLRGRLEGEAGFGADYRVLVKIHKTLN